MPTPLFTYWPYVYWPLVATVALGAPRYFKSRVDLGWIMVGMLWPAAWPMVPYYYIKRRVLKRTQKGSEFVRLLEVLGCLCVGMALTLALHLWIGNPFVRALFGDHSQGPTP